MRFVDSPYPLSSTTTKSCVLVTVVSVRSIAVVSIMWMKTISICSFADSVSNVKHVVLKGPRRSGVTIKTIAVLATPKKNASVNVQSVSYLGVFQIPIWDSVRAVNNGFIRVV